METATHLPLRAGHNRMHTAKAGCMGSICSPCFYFLLDGIECKLFSFFHDFGRLLLETREEISYNAWVYA